MSPQEKKWLKIGGGVAGAILLYKMLTPKSDSSGAANDPTNNGGTHTTMPGYVFNANTVATKLYNAMKDSGTDVAAILGALAPVSASQFNQVINAFGRRSYNTSMGNQIALPFISLPLHGLVKWLREELNDTDYSTLAARFPQL